MWRRGDEKGDSLRCPNVGYEMVDTQGTAVLGYLPKLVFQEGRVTERDRGRMGTELVTFVYYILANGLGV